MELNKYLEMRRREQELRKAKASAVSVVEEDFIQDNLEDELPCMPRVSLSLPSQSVTEQELSPRAR